MKDKCQQCGNEYEMIAGHWSQSSECSYPSLTQKQIEITTGMLMGDGYIHRKEGRNPYLESHMVTKKYLEYVDSIFGAFGNGVSLRMTAEQSAERNRESGFHPNAKSENYSDVYYWASMAHPELQEFADWYSSGRKMWPDNIKLTPTVLKHWYCGDGYWENSGTKNCIVIGVANEMDYTDKIDQFFENVGLPSPNNYSKYKVKNGIYGCNACFTVEQSKELWRYMGEPLSGFEYKWPDSCYK